MLKQFINFKTLTSIAVILLLSACGSIPSKNTEQADSVIENKPSVKQAYKVSASVEQQFAYGIEAMVQQDYLKAINIFEQVAGKEPRASGPWVNMAIAYRKLDRIDDADKAIQKAVELNPKNPYALNQAGIIKREIGAFDEAEKHYRSAYPSIRITQTLI